VNEETYRHADHNDVVDLHDLCAVLEVREGDHHIVVDKFYRLLPVAVEASHQLRHFP